MEKQFYSLLLFLLFNISCIAQQYISYYNACNQGQKQLYYQRYELALQEFEKAFELVDYVHAKQYKSASICAAQLNKHEKAYSFAKLAILQGMPPLFIQEKAFKKFRKQNLYQQLKDSILIFEKTHQHSINLSYKKAIDSLYYVDQRVIRKNRSVKGKYAIDQSTLPENLYELDSLIFLHLLSLVDQYGFPSERKIGPEGYKNASILFHHNVRLPQNTSYIPLTKKALFNGEFLPSDFAWMYDQSMIFQDKNPMFYWAIGLTDNLSEKEKKSIDQKRKEYGVKPLEATIVKKIRRGIMQKQLW